MSANNSLKRTTPVNNCIFCGAENPTSEEHALSAWIYRALENSDLEYDRFVRIAHNDFYGFHQMEAWYLSSDTTCPILCTNCNLQWGKKLQDKASRVLKPFIIGDWKNLNSSELEKITRWYVSYLLVRELHHDNHETHSQIERENFRKKGIIPKKLSVWMAPLKNLSLDSIHRPMSIIERKGDINHFHIAISCIGHTVFASFGGNPPNDLSEDSDRYKILNTYLASIGFIQILHPDKNFIIAFPEKKPGFVTVESEKELCDEMHERLWPPYHYYRKIKTYYRVKPTLLY